MAGRKESSGERRTVTKAEWIARALQLDARGWSLRKIARHLDLHHKTVAVALAREYADAKPKPEDVEAARARAVERQHERLARADKLIRQYTPSALKGDYDAAKIVIDADAKIIEKALAAIARLEGTDAPTKSEVTGKDGAPLVGGATVSEAARLVREAFGEHAMKSDDADDDAPGKTDAGGDPAVPTEPPAE